VAPSFEPLGPDSAGEVAALLARAAPDEGLDADELEDVLWDGGGVVLGSSDSDALVAVVAATTRDGGERIGHVRLLAVDPEHARRGLGRAALAEAERWLVERGSSTVVLGGEAPVYLWPGVDVAAEALVGLVEAAGYEAAGEPANMDLDVAFRAPNPDGIELRRVVEDDDVAAVGAMVAERWPHWSEEVDRGIERATVHGAFEDGRPVGFCAHSVLRTGWVGPMATIEEVRHRGIGAALLGEACRDLMVMGRRAAEIAWVGPAAFYAHLGATPGRRWRRYVRRLS
jgi:predicted N-acetyltransferase YhbS